MAGTVVICFTDIVGSTELLSRLGDDAFDDVRRGHFEALERQDFIVIARRAHALKGSSANIGAEPLSIAAANLEKAAQRNSEHEVEDLVNQVSVCLYEVNTLLRNIG